MPARAEPLGGGYWGPLGKPPPSPKDGQWLRISGASLFPIGVIRAGAGGLSIYASEPVRCAEWLDGDASTCAGLRTYGWWGVGFGSLLAISGAVLLAIGLKQGRDHARWQQQWGRRGWRSRAWRAHVRQGVPANGARF